jgi:hypothetical protein
VRNMPNRDNHNNHLEKITDRLGDSALELSDEAILSETSKAGADPQREAERARGVLQRASKVLDDLNNRLSELGHNINSNDWRPGQWGYQNTCLNCGSFVSFTTATGEMQGEALYELCPQCDQYTVRRREASRK